MHSSLWSKHLSDFLILPNAAYLTARSYSYARSRNMFNGCVE